MFSPVPALFGNAFLLEINLTSQSKRAPIGRRNGLPLVVSGSIPRVILIGVRHDLLRGHWLERVSDVGAPY